MPAIQLHDTFLIDSVRRTEGGYLTAFAKVARTGIQIYKGKELGRPDLGDVRVYRPESEVFSADAMQSMANRPMTLNHPSVAVTSKNWKQYSIGQTGEDVVRDGEFIRVPLVLMDAKAIDAYEKGGVKELSMGYSTDLKWEKGLTNDGKEYDAIQTSIRANHLAVVPVARGGQELRIGDDDTMKTCPECSAEMTADAKYCPSCGQKMTKDAGPSGSNKGDSLMTTKTITVDGVPVVLDDVAASVVQRELARNADTIKQMKDAADKLTTDAAAAASTAKTTIETLTKDGETKTGEIAALKKQLEDAKLTPEKLDALVKDRSDVIAKAKPLLDAKFVFDGKKIEDIRRAAVAAQLGDAATKDMPDASVEGAFFTLAAKAKDGSGFARVADGIRHSNQQSQTADGSVEAAYAENNKRLTDAWKTPAPTGAKQ